MLSNVLVYSNELDVSPAPISRNFSMSESDSRICVTYDSDILKFLDKHQVRYTQIALNQRTL